jgi:hypothetical protein
LEKIMHSDEKNLSGDPKLDPVDPERPIALPDQLDHRRKRNPDRELRLEGEIDTLYDDGLDLNTDELLAGTDGHGPKGIKG